MDRENKNVIYLLGKKHAEIHPNVLLQFQQDHHIAVALRPIISNYEVSSSL